MASADVIRFPDKPSKKLSAIDMMALAQDIVEHVFDDSTLVEHHDGDGDPTIYIDTYTCVYRKDDVYYAASTDPDGYFTKDDKPFDSFNDAMRAALVLVVEKRFAEYLEEFP